MTVTVVIPVYNRAHLITRALDSVINQTRPADEIILVDDGSSDGTPELVMNKYPQVSVITQTQNGVSHARNTGIRRAKGDWIAFLDSDDAWLPVKLERQLSQLSKYPEYLFVHSNEQWIRNGKRINQKSRHRKYGGFIFVKCLPLCIISPSAAVIHRSIFDDLGMFDESLPACEDYDMWLRICSRYPVLFIDEELIVKYGGHEDQLSKKYWGMDRFRIRSIVKILEQGELSGINRAAAIAILQEKIRIYHQGAIKRRDLKHDPEFTRIAANYS